MLSSVNFIFSFVSSMMTEHIKCIERHSRCYKPFAKQVFGTALFHLKKAHKRRCLTPEGRQGKKIHPFTH